LLEEIIPGQIEKIGDQFSDPQVSMVLASYREGNTRAQLWRNTKNSKLYLLWDKGNNVFYLSGNSSSKETTEDLASLIKTHIKEKAIKEGLSYFSIHALSPSSEKAIPQIFQNIQLSRKNKIFYIFRKQKLPHIQSSVLRNVKYVPIDMDFLKKKQYQNAVHVRSEIEWMWSSIDKFHENGFGCAALLEESIICWCTAEYVSTKKCGIGIETIPDYQNKGIATETASYFVKYCRSKNIIPYWECGVQNAGSVKVAEKVGFERIQENVFWVGKF